MVRANPQVGGPVKVLQRKSSLCSLGWGNRRMRLLLACVVCFGISLPAAAQSFYVTQGSSLWSYQLPSDTWSFIGQHIDTQTGALIHFPDLASDESGNLFGISIGQKLYRIDRSTGAVTFLFHLPIWANGQTFSPDGKLWATGGGSGCPGNCLFWVNIETGDTHLVGELDYNPSGDLAFNTLDQMLYMTSGYPGGRIVRINPADAQSIQEADLPLALSYPGFEVIRGTNHFLLFGSNQTRIQIEKTSSAWVFGNSSETPVAAFGVTQLHCTPQPEVLLNHQVMQPSETVSCEQPLLISAADVSWPHGYSARYRWRVTGLDQNGQSFAVELAGEGLPRALNLLSDPEFSVFQLRDFRSVSQKTFRVEFWSWCDPSGDPIHVERVLDLHGPKVDWSFLPKSEEPEYAVGDVLHFTETPGATVSNWMEQNWFLGLDLLVAGNSSGQHTASLQEIGHHELTYEVTSLGGCVTQKKKPFSVSSCALFIPNAFSPNGDGKNDVFAPVWDDLSGMQSIEWKIWNRDGTEVFQQSLVKNPGQPPLKPLPGWDGQFHGWPAPDGVYSYRIRYRHSNEEKEAHGSVILLR